MLLRLYTRWAERHGFNIEIADLQPGEGAGIKSATFEVDGEYAYGYHEGRGRYSSPGAHLALRCERAPSYFIRVGVRVSRDRRQG